MSEPETLPTGVHPEVALLPWYLNGTLGAEEQRRVARHLESCPDCRLELDELTHMKRDITAAYAAQPEPSPQLARSVFAKVAQKSALRRPASAESENWLSGLDQWIRSLFIPQWVPTLAALFVVAQLGLLFWLTLPPSQNGQVTTRGLGTQTARLSVAFHSTATEEAIRSVIETVNGRIVDGPNKKGIYTIEVPAADSQVSQNTLNLLRRNSDVVRAADLERP